MKNFLLFLFFFAITFLLYLPAIHSRFVFDFIDWFFTYQRQGWRGVLHSFNDPSLHYVYHFLGFSAVKFLGLNSLAWQILFCSLHALNALLLFTVLQKWLGRAGIKYLFAVSFISALFFLLSPYQTEVVVWGATIHYLLVVCFALLVLHFTLLFADDPRRNYLIAAHLVYVAGLFTHEIIMILPIAIFIILFLFYPQNRGIVILKIVFPQIAMIMFYFLLNRIILGKWIAHYGAETHLHFDVWELQTTFVKYFCKYLLLAQFLPDPIKNFVYTAVENHHYRVLAGLILVTLLLAVGWFKRSIVVKNLVALLFISFIALFPVLNLYFPYFINIHADRLGYFASLFIYSWLALLLFSFSRKFGLILVCMFLFFEVYALRQNTNSWKQAGILMMELERNFPTDSSKHYYLLNIPDNYKGAYMYRCLGNSKIAQAIKMKTGVDRNSQITEILSYNLLEPTDSVTIKAIDSVKLKVELSHWGAWWWKETLGATDYETEMVKVDVSDDAHSYLVEFKQKRKGDVFLYQANGIWHEIKDF